MNTWDHLAEQAHRLLTRPRRGDLTPAVTLVQSLHKQPPQSPAAICAHLETASTALPQLARYARSGDRHALLMAAVLMRHPLRRIAEMADPDGYRSSDRDARDNDTLRIFFEIIRTAAEPQILTSRYLYGQTLKRVLKARPDADSPAVAVPRRPPLRRPRSTRPRHRLRPHRRPAAAGPRPTHHHRPGTRHPASALPQLRRLQPLRCGPRPGRQRQRGRAPRPARHPQAVHLLRSARWRHDPAPPAGRPGDLPVAQRRSAAALRTQRARRELPGRRGHRRSRHHRRPTPRPIPTSPSGVLGNILEPLRKNSPVRLVTYYTPYPATIVGGTDGGGYRASKNAGIDATNARLKAVANACPKTVFILTGYSQGADVAGDVAAAIGHNRGVIPRQPTPRRRPGRRPLPGPRRTAHHRSQQTPAWASPACAPAASDHSPNATVCSRSAHHATTTATCPKATW